MALIQESVFDVAEWREDPEFAVFPQGARAKDAVFAPLQPESDVLVPAKRYLFKHSRGSYRDQFWAEIVAYRIGCLLGVNVPPAFAAVNSRTQVCAAPIEWFYEDDHERFVLAGDFLQQIFPEFDRDKGEMHNLQHNGHLLRALQTNAGLKQSWRRWWTEALLFDALIGNSDRHQDNWGVIFAFQPPPELEIKCRLSPLFDNGTSLGHERFPDRVANWSDQRISQYIERGTHHAMWSLAEPIKGHFALLEHALRVWKQALPHVVSRLTFTVADFERILVDLRRLDLPVPLEEPRAEFMLRLLTHRYNRLLRLVDSLQ